jgi:hypothetical protein
MNKAALALFLGCSLAVVAPEPAPAADDWWQPAVQSSWQIQLQGAIDTTFSASVYDVDLFDTSRSVIDLLHAQGSKVVCYFSAGSWEDWRPDASRFPAVVKGRSNGWPGEKWLDIRRLDILGSLMAARLDLAADKGCDGVDPDNVDGYTNRTGFPLTAAHQLKFNTWLATEAHARRMAVGLKNDLEQVAQLVASFDFAVNEQCFEYKECNLLLPFIQAGKPVFGIEYSGNPSTFCPKANNMGFSTQKKSMSLGAKRTDCLSQYP